MSRPLAIVIAVAVLGLLGAPVAAPAKEVSEVSVCGTGHQCTTYDKTNFKDLTFLAQDAGPAEPPAAPAPWYRVRFTVDERAHGGGYARWSVAYVPAADRLRVTDESGTDAWVALTPRAAATLRRAARGVSPFPAARLRGMDAGPPRARVDAVYPPPARAAATSGTTSWAWLAAGVAAVLLMVAAVAAIRWRRRGAGVAAVDAGG
jgi:hypothetical protein